MHNITRFLPILTIILVTIAALPATITHATSFSSEGIVPLDYTNSGTEIWRGVKVEVEMYAEGAKGIQSYAFASAGLLVGDVKIEITADPPGWGGFGSIPVYIKVYDNGSIVYSKKIDEIGFNDKKIYDAAVTLYWPCNGPMQISIQESYTGTQWNGELDPGTPPVDIWYEDGRVDPILGPSAQSHVTVGEAQVVDSCGGPIGDLPQPGEGGSGGHTDNTNNTSKLMWIAIGLAAALILAIIVKL